MFFFWLIETLIGGGPSAVLGLHPNCSYDRACNMKPIRNLSIYVNKACELCAFAVLILIDFVTAARCDVRHRHKIRVRMAENAMSAIDLCVHRVHNYRKLLAL